MAVLPAELTYPSTFVSSKIPHERRMALRFIYMIKEYMNRVVSNWSHLHSTEVMTKYDKWFQTIARSTLYEASLPQDRVFAALGMIGSLQDDRNRTSLMRVDHGIHFKDVYAEFIKTAIELSQDLRCLDIFSDRTGHDPQVPSYAIDLCVPKSRYDIVFECSRIYNPWHIRSKTESPEFVLDRQHGSTLKLHGRSIGCILARIGDEQYPKAEQMNVILSKVDANPTLRWCFDPHRAWKRKAEPAMQQPPYNLELQDDNEAFVDIFDRLKKECCYKWMRFDVSKTSLSRPAIVAQARSHRDWVALERRLLRIERCALVSQEAMPGDALVYLHGAKYYYILRRVQDRGWLYLGPALVVDRPIPNSDSKRLNPRWEQVPWVMINDYHRGMEDEWFTLI